MRWLAVFLLVACSTPDAIAPSAGAVLPHAEVQLDTAPRQHRRMVPPEAFLRAYLMWFGGLAPDAVRRRAGDLLGSWEDYLSALGLPDYAHDFPRVTQSNALMLSTMARLGEALCVRAAEHDLQGRMPIDQRLIFAFEAKPSPSRDEFAAGFDVLHRTFLGYPASLAPAGRIDRFYALYQKIAAHHAGATVLTPDETAWVAICAALVVHPEAELY